MMVASLLTAVERLNFSSPKTKEITYSLNDRTSQSYLQDIVSVSSSTLLHNSSDVTGDCLISLLRRIICKYESEMTS